MVREINFVVPRFSIMTQDFQPRPSSADPSLVGGMGPEAPEREKYHINTFVILKPCF